MPFLRRLLRHAWEPYVLLPAVAAVLLAVIWWGTLGIVRQNEQEASAAALQATERLMDTYEAQTLRVINEVQQSLRLVAYARRFAGADGELAQLQAQNLLLPNLFFTTRLLNAQGRILDSSRAAALDQPVSPSVVEHHARRGGVFVSPPYRVPGGDEPVIDISRRAGDGPGSEIIVITMPASYLVSAYDEQRFGASGVVAVVGEDGVFRALRTGARVEAGGTTDVHALVPATAEEQAAAVLRPSPWDGVVRYTVARSLYGFPLALVIALPESEQLAPTRATSRKLLAEASVASAAVVAVALVLSLLTRHIRILRRRERLAREEHARHVEHLAYHDSLTSLANRAHFNRTLAARLAEGRELGRPFALLLLDLDGFKKVNDVHGHQAGDLLLQQVAQRLTQCVRDTDLVARLGGDEFVVLLSGGASGELSGGVIDEVARRIVLSVARPYDLAGITASVTASVGVAVYPQDGLDEDALTRHADQAMYVAKELGKNRVQYGVVHEHTASDLAPALQAGATPVDREQAQAEAATRAQ